MKKNDGYEPRMEELLARLGTDLTEQDFAKLALVCADQAGMPTAKQIEVSRMLGLEFLP